MLRVHPRPSFLPRVRLAYTSTGRGHQQQPAAQQDQRSRLRRLCNADERLRLCCCVLPVCQCPELAVHSGCPLLAFFLKRVRDNSADARGRRLLVGLLSRGRRLQVGFQRRSRPLIIASIKQPFKPIAALTGIPDRQEVQTL